MTTYVLIPGAWLGGWVWRDVTPRLRAAGHDVYTPTLTGLGERSHLARPDVDLGTHIQDVVNVLEFEDLHDIVLLGHSYAGAVVASVADRVPNRIARLVYLDSGPLPDGLAFLDLSPPEAKQHAERQVAEHGDGWQLPVPSWDELERVNGANLDGLGDRQRRLFRAHAVPQPFGTYTQPSRRGPARAELPKLLISCSFPLDQVRDLIAGGHPWFRELAGPEWQLLELRTSHWPMFSAPNELADLLLTIASAD